jgi:NADPH:quinone reductase-like Zn-dependent oxidoreductase
MKNRALVMQRAGLHGLAFEDREASEPGPGEALVRLRASCLNYHDLMVMLGRSPTLAYPRIPLSDGAGEVVAVGAGVRRVAQGDRVCPNFYRDWIAGPPEPHHWLTVFGDAIDGCGQQLLCLPAEALARIPDHLSNLEAATLPCAGVTAWVSLERASARAGETVLVQGTGGVSIFGLQLAKARGCRVIVTSSSDEKLARVTELGADGTINYQTRPDWEAAALELTEARGVDVILDVGGEQTLGRSIACAATGGRIAMIGVLSGYGNADFNPAATFMKRVSLFGIAVGSRADFDAMNRCIEASRIVPVISDTFSIEETAAACDRMQSGGHFGKIALTLD